MPLVATRGAASAQGFGEFAQSAAPTYIEDVFSTYLYTGNGSTQTITNGIDLSTYGGLVWTKCRNDGVLTHRLNDTVRGITNRLFSNLTNAQSASATSITAVSTTGYTVGSENGFNQSSNTFVSWTFRKQPKFFDVVTYTGNGGANNVVNHSLAASIGMLVIKRTDSTGNWSVFVKESGGNYSYWNSSGTGTGQGLNGTGAATGTNYSGFNAYLTTTSFDAAQIDGSNNINANGASFVAYLFASSNSGGFGLSGSDNVISCGSFTTDGSGNATVSLGYEPQWILVKNTQTSGTSWVMLDNMRGWTMGNDSALLANLSNAENTGDNYGNPTATGFYINNNGGTWAASNTHIYIAIRRGPMKTPTSGTSVYNAVTYTGNQTARNITGYGFPLDLVLGGRRNDTNNFKDYWFDRLRGATKAIDTNVSGGTAAEYTDAQVQTSFALQDGTSVGTDSTWNATGINIVLWGLRRAPGFFDEVCYTGNGVDNRDITHNLGVAPELLIVKNRSAAGGTDWPVYAAPIGATQNLYLNDPGNSFTSNNYWRDSTPTATTFRVGTNSYVNANTNTYVAYLFATCPGVSKVGGYTGSGTTKQIDCGFTGGARFVMIKRTDSNGDWYVWDSTRGIVAGNDPYLLMNSTAAEVTNTDYIDTYSAGFEISSTAPAAINANGGSFVFLAIA